VPATLREKAMALALWFFYAGPSKMKASKFSFEALELASLFIRVGAD
jgi:hypothetical protein